MTTTLSLFGGSLVEPQGDPMARVSSPVKLARRTDPETSKIAAREYAESGKLHSDCRDIIAALKRLEACGRTDTTPTVIAMEAWGTLDNVRVSRRSGDLRGVIEGREGLTIVCPLKKTKMKPWRLVK